MAPSAKLNFKASDTDLVCELLAEKGCPLYYHDLINAVLNKQKRDSGPAQIADVLTQMNLDPRLAYQGNGEWGLKAWATARPVKKTTGISTLKGSANERLPFEGDSDPFDEAEADYEADLELDESGDEDSEDDSASVFAKNDEYEVLEERSGRASWR